MSSFVNWQWQSENVQAEVKNGEYISAESALILAGPSRLSMLSTDGGVDTTNSLIPIGLIQGFGSSQNRQVQRLFEIGSKRAYFVPGRMFANFTIARIMFYGPSLMRLLYGLAPSEVVDPFTTGLNTDPDSSGNFVSELPEYSALFGGSLVNAPGYGGSSTENENRDVWMNLASELFNVPFGMCLLMKDTRDQPYGAVYMEDCYLETHNMSIDAGNVVIAENVSGQFDRLEPIQLNTLPS
jgi:hypothetical protein